LTHSFKKTLIVCTFIVLVVVLSFGFYTDWQWSLTQKNQAASNPEKTTREQQWAIKVTTRAVETQSNDRRFQAIGTAQARLSIDVYSAVAEDVVKVLFDAEQQVSQNDLLVKLDDQAEVLALKSAEIRLKEAKRVLNEFARALKQNAVPNTNVAAARAEVQQAEVALQQAQVALDYRSIRAPFAGIIGISQIDPGSRITTTTPIAPLDDRSIMDVDFNIPESLANQIQHAKSDNKYLEVTTPAFPARSFQAKIQSIESRIDPTARTQLVRLSIVNDKDLLRPGMSFRVDWRIKGQDLPSVPEIAVQWGRDGPYVWLIRDQRAQSVPVKIIARKIGRVLVEGELQAGEAVVIEGVQRMRPNIQVGSNPQ